MAPQSPVSLRLTTSTFDYERKGKEEEKEMKEGEKP